MASDVFLRRFRPVFDALAGDEVHAVSMTTHHVTGDIVGDDPVGALGDLLGDRMFSLSSEAEAPSL